MDETTSLTASQISATSPASSNGKRSVFNMDLWMVPVAIPGNDVR